uniref:Uncharacterized protein n=1 Tax=Rhizophora mucronata TaxID=61149 RepID=A0A2P2QQ97_RHIMU
MQILELFPLETAINIYLCVSIASLSLLAFYSSCLLSFIDNGGFIVELH